MSLPSHANALARRDAIIRHDAAYHNYQRCLIALRNAYDGDDESAVSVATDNLVNADKELVDAEMNLQYAEELCNPKKPQSWPKDYGTFN
jgi:5-methylcytosine-specific restriction endonuclease McrA